MTSKEKKRARDYARYWRDPQKAIKLAREWNQKHPSRVKAGWKRYRVVHPSNVNHRAMMSRCYNTKDICYSSYGGRGISVHTPWHSFLVYEREFGYLKPMKGYVVDRIDNDGNYEPGNVRWVTAHFNNKRGKTKCVSKER